MFLRTLAAASVSEQLPRAAVRVPRATRDFRFIYCFDTTFRIGFGFPTLERVYANETNNNYVNSINIQ